MSRWVLSLVFLSICTYTDIKTRKIHLAYCIGFAAVLPIINIWDQSMRLAGTTLAVIPGMILVSVSMIKSEAIGLGDGIVVMVLGLYVGVVNIMNSMLFSFLLMGVAAMMMLVFRKDGRKKTFPAVPFIMAGHCIAFVNYFIG